MVSTVTLNSEAGNPLNDTFYSSTSASAELEPALKYGIIVQKLGEQPISYCVWTPSDPALFYHVQNPKIRPYDKIVLGTWIVFESTRLLAKKNQTAQEWKSEYEICGAQPLNQPLVPTRQNSHLVACVVEMTVDPQSSNDLKYIYASNDFFGSKAIIIPRDKYSPKDFGENKIRRAWIIYERLNADSSSSWAWKFSEFAESTRKMTLPQTILGYQPVDEEWQGNNLFVVEPNSNTNISVYNEYARGFGALYKRLTAHIKSYARLDHFGFDEEFNDENYGVVVSSESRYAVIWGFKEDGYVLIPDNMKSNRIGEKLYDLGDWVTYQAYDRTLEDNDIIECIYKEVFELPALLPSPKLNTIALSFTFIIEVEQLNVLKSVPIRLGAHKFYAAYNDLVGVILVPVTKKSEEIMSRDLSPKMPADFFDDVLKNALISHVLTPRYCGTEEEFYLRHRIKPRIASNLVTDIVGIVVPTKRVKESFVHKSTVLTPKYILMLPVYFQTGIWLALSGNIFQLSENRGECISVSGQRVVHPPMPTRLVNKDNHDELLLCVVVTCTTQRGILKNPFIGRIIDAEELVPLFDPDFSQDDRYLVEVFLTVEAQRGLSIGPLEKPAFRVAKVHSKWREGQPIGVALKDSVYPASPGFIFNARPEDDSTPVNQDEDSDEENMDEISETSTLVGDEEVESVIPIGDVLPTSRIIENDSVSIVDTEAESTFYQADWDD